MDQHAACAQTEMSMCWSMDGNPCAKEVVIWASSEPMAQRAADSIHAGIDLFVNNGRPKRQLRSRQKQVTFQPLALYGGEGNR